MQTYFGTKEIKARPMSRQEYNDYRGLTLSADEDGADAGYLVEYLDGGQSNHPNHEGYISWSPADVFDRAYQPHTAMSFSHAMVAAKAGRNVAREGWNGKGMFVYMVPGSLEYDGVAQYFTHFDGIPTHLFHTDGDTGTAPRLPVMAMRTATGAILHGWLATQTDMFADDWMVVDD